MSPTPTAAKIVDEALSAAFTSDDWVLAPGTAPRFGDDVWMLRDHIVSTAQRARTVDLGSIPPGWRLLTREVLILIARPDHPIAMEAGVVRRARPAGPGGLVGRFHCLRTIARWAAQNGCETPSSWSALHTRRFVQALERGRHAPGAQPASASTIRGYTDALKLVWQLTDALSAPKMQRSPVGDDRMKALPVGKDSENVTQPLPWPAWSAIVRAGTFILRELAPDIIAADRRRRELPRCGRQGSGTAAERLDAFLASGRLLPTHTGRGRGPSERGTLNRTMFSRTAGIADSVFNPATNGHQPDFVRRVLAVASAQEPVAGGLEPSTWATAAAESWDPELAPWEVEHLVSVVRAAAYLLLAALTGMRDSELQQLERGCIVQHEHELPALRSLQFKGEAALSGRERTWFAPPPVFLAVDVLQRLSPHPTLLFARSPNGGGYLPWRDIKRFVAFVNDAPDVRVGRGNELPLERVAAAGVAVNQQTMRRSFAVYSARYPGAELGLGIQLGHAALRMTAGYYLDSQERVSRLVDDERRTAMNDVVRAMVDGTPAVGGGAQHLRSFAAQTISSPARSTRLLEQLAEHYHLGQLNDCHYRAALAACGTDGPQLADRRCGTGDCANAVITERHLPAWTTQVQRIDQQLAKDGVHPAFQASLRATRVEITSMLQPLRDTDPEDI